MTTATLEQEALPLHLKYRPTDFSEVIGHSDQVKSMQALATSPGRPHTYLFTGPAGTGKTTLARVLAKQFGCDPTYITEVDAGSFGDVASIRALVEEMKYAPAVGEAKVVIIDECHVLSKAAWQALLKMTEEPPKHVYWIFCTTVKDKVDKALITRAHAYNLKPVAFDMLKVYAQMICDIEEIALPTGALELISERAEGSVRQMLVNLSTCRTAQTLEQVAQLLSTTSEDESDPVFQIARLVAKKSRNWGEYKTLLAKIENFGGARLTLAKYMQKVVLNSDWKTFLFEMEAIEKMPAFLDDKDGLFHMEMFLFRVMSH